MVALWDYPSRDRAVSVCCTVCALGLTRVGEGQL